MVFIAFLFAAKTEQERQRERNVCLFLYVGSHTASFYFFVRKKQETYLSIVHLARNLTGLLFKNEKSLI
jgi:hypothetical protein